LISINEERVRDLAHSISSLRLAPDFAEQITPRLRASDEAALRAFLWASAICHSTKGGLKGAFSGISYKGWDYLLRSFCAATEDNEKLVSPEYISNISGKELLDLLSRYAEAPQVTLPDIDRRAEILNVCATQLLEIFQGHVKSLLNNTKNKVAGDSGAYAQLALLDAFRDPLKKKSSAFLMTVHFSHLWEIADQENVLPMIDYHRMRVLCRTGCITIHDPKVLQSLISQTSVSPDVENSIRQAAAEVCKQVVILSKIPMFECDVLIWAHARSCCRHFPLCVSKQLENDSFYEYIEKDYEGACEFQEWCPGYRNSTIRSIWEPMIETERY
jgi:hypothetical protein